MALVVLAPNIPAKAGRMFVPESMIPKETNVAPGTEPPVSVKITRLLVGGFFMGPFGAMAGCGVGLLLQGAFGKRQKPGPAGNAPAASEPKG